MRITLLIINILFVSSVSLSAISSLDLCCPDEEQVLTAHSNIDCHDDMNSKHEESSDKKCHHCHLSCCMTGHVLYIGHISFHIMLQTDQLNDYPLYLRQTSNFINPLLRPPILS